VGDPRPTPLHSKPDRLKYGVRPVIPPRSNRFVSIRWNKRLYLERNRLEWMIGHLKVNRAIATRYDKLAESFLGMLYLGAIKLWLRFVHRAEPKTGLTSASTRSVERRASALTKKHPVRGIARFVSLRIAELGEERLERRLVAWRHLHAD